MGHKTSDNCSSYLHNSTIWQSTQRLKLKTECHSPDSTGGEGNSFVTKCPFPGVLRATVRPVLYSNTKSVENPYQNPTAAARNPSWEFHIAQRSVTLSQKLLFLFRHCPFLWNRKDKELSYWLAASRGTLAFKCNQTACRVR